MRKEHILMHRNKATCSITFDDEYRISRINEIYDFNEMPLGYVENEDGHNIKFLRFWWDNNGIPSNRDGIEISLAILDISSVEELHFKGHGISLNNHYWIKTPEENLKWEDVNYWENPFTEEMGKVLFNQDQSIKKIFTNSPDTATNGMMKKRWVRRNDGIYLEKKGIGPVNQEVYNEWLISRILSLTSANAVRYDIEDDKGCSCICKAFTSQELEFIPYMQLYYTFDRDFYYDDNNFEIMHRILKWYDVSYSKEQLDVMFFIDRIVSNTDRHYNNVGFLRDESGKLELAPIFDNGNSLWYETSTKDICTDLEAESDLFYEIENCPNIDKYSLNEVLYDFSEIALKNRDFIPERISIICNAIKNRYIEFKNRIEERYTIRKK